MRALFRTPLAVVFAVVLVAALAVGPCVPAPALSVSTVLSGLHRPWDLAFTPDGGMLFTEKGGAIRFRHRDGLFVRTLADPIDSIVMGEGGMMGVAVDPSFQSNRRVYTCFLSNLGGAPDVRVVRWRMNDAVTALTDRVDIVTGIPVTSGRHSGCRTRFGPDGRLWIGTGDAASPTVPQSPTSLGGKVLRVNTSGQGVPGNAPAPFDPRIYTYGHRNVQGIAFSPGGNAYAIEHGTDRDDEVNRLFAGSNYGWDPRPLSGPMSYDESRPMTDTARHPGARGAVWSSGFPTIAPSGGDFTRGPGWKAWDGSLAMAVLKGQQLRVLRLDNNGLAVDTQWVSITDQGRLRVAVMHPSDGHLYLATDSDPGRILRVIPELITAVYQTGSVRVQVRTLLAIALVVVLAVGSSTIAGRASAAVPGPAPTLSVSTVLSGLHRPWDLAFTPGGGMLFTEKGGAIRFRHRDGTFVRTLADPTDSIVMGEGGMMGVAVDPGFRSNRRVYTCFLSNRAGSPDVRVVRWRMNDAVTALTDRVDIVTGIPVTSGRHSGCRTRFGPDGRLWIGTGDSASPTVPQSPTSLGGKVLRVDTSGRGLPGNAPAPFDPRIYTYGHRNVQGIAFSPGGKAYSIEHGTGRDDELNRLFAGANYGWDPRPLSGSLFYDESRPMTDTTRHPGARRAVWSSGNPTIAPSGGDFIRGPAWKGWDRSVAMAVLKGQQLRVLRLDNNGLAVDTQWVRITNQGRLRVAVMHPSNGVLYLATDSDPGSILRVRAG